MEKKTKEERRIEVSRQIDIGMERKTESAEEAAQKAAGEIFSIDTVGADKFKRGFEAGASWKEKQMFTREDMEKAWKEGRSAEYAAQFGRLDAFVEFGVWTATHYPEKK